MLGYLTLILLYPVLQFLLVPASYRCTYDRYPAKGRKHIASVFYWATILLPLAGGANPAFAGIVMHTLGATLTVLAMRVNPFFVPAATWLPGQYLVKDGVYRYLKHPGYTGMLVMCLGNVTALGAWSGLPAILYLSFLLFQLRKENEVLALYARK